MNRLLKHKAKTKHVQGHQNRREKRSRDDGHYWVKIFKDSFDHFLKKNTQSDLHLGEGKIIRNFLQASTLQCLVNSKTRV